MFYFVPSDSERALVKRQELAARRTHSHLSGQMITLAPISLEGHGVRLEPMALSHASALSEAASDGKLWELWFTSVPEPQKMAEYVDAALAGQRDGHMLAWVVRELASGRIVGTTRYHDIVREIDRVEIGWTWYARSMQRTHVNSACKLLLLRHAFDTLGLSLIH